MKCDFYIFDPAQPSFELGRDFIGTKLLTKFHEDGTRIVASRVFTSKCLRTDGRTNDGQRPVTKAHLSNQIEIDWEKIEAKIEMEYQKERERPDRPRTWRSQASSKNGLLVVQDL
ncbi:hypothetical protein DPMN_133602 [Dreissena polymorpha]|uniref:Uncharacterized protein n=1 Tax=Dreissena polymorpha TaxID=45954 RepID=A0A9D4FXC0_DREPO|nr:hypothetical protein DPMN_133602 [Dreissena polymorpha]